MEDSVVVDGGVVLVDEGVVVVEDGVADGGVVVDGGAVPARAVVMAPVDSQANVSG